MRKETITRYCCTEPGCAFKSFNTEDMTAHAKMHDTGGTATLELAELAEQTRKLESTVGRLLIQQENLKREVAFYKDVVNENLGFCDHCGKYYPLDLMAKVTGDPKYCINCYQPERSMFDPGGLQDEPHEFNERKEDGEL